MLVDRIKHKPLKGTFIEKLSLEAWPTKAKVTPPLEIRLIHWTPTQYFSGKIEYQSF